MADVEWTGGIRRHELHVHWSTLTDVGSPVGLVGANQCGDPAGDDVEIDAEVDEARSRNLRRPDTRAIEVERLDDSLCKVTRFALQWLREHQREVRRPVTERWIARTL